MRRRSIALSLALPLVTAASIRLTAVPADTCERQRALFPAKWSDTGGEKIILECLGHYARPVVRASAADAKGLRQLSVASGGSVYRAIIDRSQYGALIAGRRTGLFLKSETSCSIRGNTSDVVYGVFGTAGGTILVNGSLDEIDECRVVR